mgnify:CR=1 FL=1
MVISYKRRSWSPWRCGGSKWYRFDIFSPSAAHGQICGIDAIKIPKAIKNTLDEIQEGTKFPYDIISLSVSKEMS